MSLDLPEIESERWTAYQHGEAQRLWGEVTGPAVQEAQAPLAMAHATDLFRDATSGAVNDAMAPLAQAHQQSLIDHATDLFRQATAPTVDEVTARFEAMGNQAPDTTEQVDQVQRDYGSVTAPDPDAQLRPATYADKKSGEAARGVPAFLQPLIGGIAARLGKQRENEAAAYSDLTPGAPAMTPEKLDQVDAVAMGAEAVGPGVENAAAGMAKRVPEKALARLASEDLPAGAQAITNTAAQEVERLRLDKFPEAVRPMIQEAAERMGFAQGQRRGVISDATAQQMGTEAGRTVEDWLRTGKAGRAYNTEELHALSDAVASQAEKVRQAVETHSAAGVDAPDRMLADVLTQGERLQALTALREGARAEAGRSLRAFRDTASITDQPAEAVARIFKKVGGRDNALAAVSEYQGMLSDGATPVQQAKFWARVENPPPGITDWWRLLRYNSMLSGPRTFEVNLVGNALELPWRLARDTGASLVRGHPEELQAEASGLLIGLQKGARAARESVLNGMTEEAALAGEVPKSISARVTNPVAKGVATTLEVPGRLLGAADEFAHQTAYSMALGRRAAKMATAEGLAGAQWTERVTELLDQPDAPMMREAKDIADRMTFHGDMGWLGNQMTRFFQPGPDQPPAAQIIGNVVMPFMRTTYHLTARAIDRSAVGLLGTAWDVARGAYRGGKVPTAAAPLGERLTDNVLGSLIQAGLFYEALNGNISGSGPDNPQEKKVLQAQGWQPYSVRIGGRWVSYANWGPWALSIAEPAAAAEAWTYRKPGADIPRMFVSAAARTTRLVQEQTYLQSIGSVWKTIESASQSGDQLASGAGRLAGNVAGSLVPFGSAINTVAQATDSVNRQPAQGDIAGQVAARIPGLRQQQPVQRDVFGNAVPNQYSGAMALVPGRISAPANPATASIRRYIGSQSAAQDYQIAQAIDHVTRYRNHPKQYSKPGPEEIALYNRFSGRENPRYQQLISRAASAQREQKTGVSQPATVADLFTPGR